MCLKSKTGVNKSSHHKISSKLYESLRVARAEILRLSAGPTHPNRGRKTGRTSADFTPEWKAKISASKKHTCTGNRNPMYGKTHSEAVKAKISATKKSKASDPTWNIRPPCSPEKALKIKEANTGKKWIHNKLTKERKYIDPSLVNNFLSLGWELGLGKKTMPC